MRPRNRPRRGVRRPRVVVVGAGFGGMSVARELRKAPVDVVVVDRNNYNGFWPLLYQVATGIVETQEIAYPVRSLLRKHANADFRLGTVESVDFDAKRVVTDDGEALDYDYLVLAGGSATNYFGNGELASHTFGLKDVEEADRLRNHVLSAAEAAARTGDWNVRRSLLTFVIVGGGPTGVELAGQLSLLLHRALPREFPSMDLSLARVVLVNASDGILDSFPPKLRAYARERLEALGVELRLGETVTAVEDGTVELGGGGTIDATTVVWAAGVRACDLAGTIGVSVRRAGRVEVTPTLSVPGRDDVYAIGDMAYLEGYDGGGAYPMVAQVAIQQGRLAARNIAARIAGRTPAAFRYFDKGQMAVIGRRSAVMDGFGVRLRGLPAWLGWFGLHIMYLHGFRNRLVVVFDWLVAYASRSRSAGIITRPEAREHVELLQSRRRAA
jgi:NADH dehydrogenase